MCVYLTRRVSTFSFLSLSFGFWDFLNYFFVVVFFLFYAYTLDLYVYTYYIYTINTREDDYFTYSRTQNENGEARDRVTALGLS